LFRGQCGAPKRNGTTSLKSAPKTETPAPLKDLHEHWNGLAESAPQSTVRLGAKHVTEKSVRSCSAVLVLVLGRQRSKHVPGRKASFGLVRVAVENPPPVKVQVPRELGSSLAADFMQRLPCELDEAPTLQLHKHAAVQQNLAK